MNPAGRGAALAVGAVLVLVLTACTGSEPEDPVVVGLITKQEDNPYWVTMREIAQETADEEGVELLTATGTSDVDVDSQVAALEEMVADGVDGILIAPTDSTALVPAIESARQDGVIVIAVDTPVDPEDAVDAFFATDNLAAGDLVGRYAAAKAAELGLEPRVAVLDLAPGIASGELRREGFFSGFGLEEDDPRLVGTVDTRGDREEAEAAMEQLLTEDPDVNVVYAVNEPAASGALDALEAAGSDLDDVVVVAIDGGCQAIKDGVRPRRIDATSQQYPENMAREGVRAIADAVREGEEPSGFLDTGVRLITDSPAADVDSEDVAFGVRNCWG